MVIIFHFKYYLRKQYIFGESKVTVSVLGQDKGYTIKYTASPEGVSKGKAGRGLFDCISEVES